MQIMVILGILVLNIQVGICVEKTPFFPKAIPGDFWTRSPREAAIALVQAAYEAQGQSNVRVLTTEKSGQIPPKRFSVSFVTKALNFDEAEHSTSLCVDGDQAKTIVSISEGHYRWSNLNPNIHVQVKPLEHDRIIHVAKVLWWFQRIKTPDLRTDEKLKGFLLSEHSTATMLRFECEADATENVSLFGKNIEPTQTDEHLSGHILVLAGWLIRNVAGNAWDRRGRIPVTEKSIEDLLTVNTTTPLPWLVLGHLAQEIGCKGYAKLLPNLKARIGEENCQFDSATQAIIDRGENCVLREVAIERIREACGRIEHTDDVEYLIRWVTEKRYGVFWATERLRAIAPQSLQVVYRQRIERVIANPTLGDADLNTLWSEVLHSDLQQAIALARRVPPDHARHPLALQAFQLLASKDATAAAIRVPFLVKEIPILSEAFGWKRAYIEALVPSDDPQRFDDASINTMLAEMINPSEEVLDAFPASEARALIRRKQVQHIPRICDLAKQHLSQMPAQFGDHDLLATVCEIHVNLPEFHERTSSLIQEYFDTLVPGSWDVAYFFAWAIDWEGVKKNGIWDMEYGDARLLDQVWRNPDPLKRLEGLLQLLDGGYLVSYPDPLLVRRWKSQWESSLKILPQDQRETLITSIENKIQTVKSNKWSLSPLLNYAASKTKSSGPQK